MIEILFRQNDCTIDWLPLYGNPEFATDLIPKELMMLLVLSLNKFRVRSDIQNTEKDQFKYYLFILWSRIFAMLNFRPRGKSLCSGCEAWNTVQRRNTTIYR